MASIRILQVEDSPDDAELSLRELRRAGLDFTARRTDSEIAVREALREQAPDIVLSDHALPGFRGLDVLRIVHDERPGTPVIIVTGSINEETAAEYMKAGAIDYVVKDRLIRLGSAISRALDLHRALLDAARAEGARMRSELRFRKLVEYSSDVITLLDANGRIVYSTQSLRPTLGYGPGELLGHTVFSLVHPDDRAAAFGLFSGVFEHKQSMARGALRIRHLDGSWRDLEVVVADHLDDPVVEAVIVNYRDVTERKRAESAVREMEEARRQAQKMEAIGRVASGVAHDFNNLLTVISGCVDMAIHALPPGHESRTEMTLIREATDSAAALTRQLLAFSREQPIVPQTIDLNALVASVTGMLRRLVGAHVTVEFSPVSPVETVWADPGQLEQVVMNLVVNARDAMPRGGTVTIETRNVDARPPSVAERLANARGPYVVLSVKDTGTGMTEETRMHLFEPFFTTKPKGEGTGLGLATVYGIVHQAGGFTEVRSELGRGTTFEVFLPRTR